MLHSFLKKYTSLFNYLPDELLALTTNVIHKAYIEESGGKRLGPEMQDVYEELRYRSIPVELFAGKRIHRRDLPITKDTLVVGYVQTILAVLQILMVPSPPTNDYPVALQPLLYRRIWSSTVGDLTAWIYEGSDPIFAKPQGRKKRFTGNVFKQPDDLRFFEKASAKTPILCAEVVEWVTEYRVFVISGHLVGIRHYSGDSTVPIDERVAIEAIRLLNQSNESTAAYAIDLGVLSTGQTALVEWNDGYSLGSYGLDRSIYTNLLIARWNELMDE